MQYKLPLAVRCIREFRSTMYPTMNFGNIGQEYDVQAIVPNGCKYALRGRHGGAMMGEPGDPNHIVNMDRFEVIQWMTPEGIV